LLASIWATFILSMKLDSDDYSQSWDHHWNISWKTSRVMAMHFNVSHFTVKDILSRELGLRKFSRRRVPYQLSDPQKNCCVDTSVELLALLDQYSELQFEGIVTGDESWVCYHIESDSIFRRQREEVIRRLRPGIWIKKL
jgi:hypothetical protein